MSISITFIILLDELVSKGKKQGVRGDMGKQIGNKEIKLSLFIEHD